MRNMHFRFEGERRDAVFAFSYRRSVSFQIVTEGTRIVLPCTATGVPEPEHVWFNVSFFNVLKTGDNMEICHVLYRNPQKGFSQVV